MGEIFGIIRPRKTEPGNEVIPPPLFRTEGPGGFRLLITTLLKSFVFEPAAFDWLRLSGPYRLG